MTVVAIVGSRDYPRKTDVRDEMYAIHAKHGADTTIISGGARGVDTWAVDYAKWFGFPTVVFPADWKNEGHRAGYTRNVKLVDAADDVVVFWDGTSKGTRHTIELALAKHKDLKVVFP